MIGTRDVARSVFVLLLSAASAFAASGTIVVGNNVTNTILGIDPSTGTQTLVSSGGSLCTPEGIAIDSNGHLVVASACSNEILRIDPATGARTVVSSGGHLSYPSGVAIDADGTIVVANYGTACPPGANTVIRVQPATGAQTIVSSGASLVCPTDLALDAAGNVFVTSQIANTIVRIDRATGGQAIVSAGGALNAPAAIRVDASGKLIVANAGADEILRVDPATGAQTVISAGGSLHYPSGLDIDMAGNFVVANYSANSVVSVNATTGAQTGVSSGGNLNFPTRLTIVRGPALQEVTLTFDDVPTNGPGSFALTGYGGFNWDIGGWGLQSDIDYAGSGGGNSYGSPSGAYAAMGANGPLSLWRSIESPPGSCCIKEPFDFVGASFSAFTLNNSVYHNSAVTLTISGYRSGTLVATETFSLGAGYVWLGVNFRNIDQLDIRGFNGGFGFSAIFLMDDFTFRAASAVPPNTAPTARAGDNQVVRPGASVQLDGSGSYDDNTPTSQLQFSWSLVSGPAGSAVTLSGANTMTPSFVPDLSGTYVAELIVTDEGGLASAPAQVTVGGNPPPTADAGPAQLVIVGSPVTLTGAGSDPDGDALTFAWTLSAPAGSSASPYNPAAATTTFVADLAGVYTAQLTVSDGVGPSQPATVQVTATTAAGYAEIQIQSAGAAILALPADAVTNHGNQNSLTQLLSNAVVALQKGRSNAARVHLEQAISRTDGCALRGAPDGTGPGRDWITSCSAQESIYRSLMEALATAP